MASGEISPWQSLSGNGGSPVAGSALTSASVLGVRATSGGHGLGLRHLPAGLGPEQVRAQSAPFFSLPPRCRPSIYHRRESRRLQGSMRAGKPCVAEQGTVGPNGLSTLRQSGGCQSPHAPSWLLEQNYPSVTRCCAKNIANDLLLLSGSRFPGLASGSSSLRWDRQHLCG